MTKNLNSLHFIGAIKVNQNSIYKRWHNFFKSIEKDFLSLAEDSTIQLSLKNTKIDKKTISSARTCYKNITHNDKISWLIDLSQYNNDYVHTSHISDLIVKKDFIAVSEELKANSIKNEIKCNNHKKNISDNVQSIQNCDTNLYTVITKDMKTHKLVGTTAANALSKLAAIDFNNLQEIYIHIPIHLPKKIFSNNCSFSTIHIKFDHLNRNLMLSFLFKFFDRFAHGIAIDLGTANTVIYVRGRGIVLNEPSVVATVNYKGHWIVYAVGSSAKLMLGRTPSEITAIRPLKDGVIADFRGAGEMIKYFMRSVQLKRFLIRPRVIVCVPYGSTPVERRAIQEAVECAGAREVFLIEEPMAAAIGANLPVSEPTGSMVVDIGGGTTEIAIIALGGIVAASSIRVGGDMFDEAIVKYIRQHYNLIIGEATAEKIKKTIGAACILDGAEVPQMIVKGRDFVTGIPKEIRLAQEDIVESLQDPISSILGIIRSVLEKAPPELSADIVDRGIVITGGGALLRGLSDVIREATKLPILVAENPLYSVAMGTGKVVDFFSEYQHVLFRQD